MAREALPNRRPSEILSIEHANADGVRIAYEICVDRYLDDRIGEVVVTSPGLDSMLGALCHDAANLISLALQHGISPADLREEVARYGSDHPSRPNEPKSGIGAIVEALARIQIDYPHAVSSRAQNRPSHNDFSTDETWRYVLSSHRPRYSQFAKSFH